MKHFSEAQIIILTTESWRKVFVTDIIGIPESMDPDQFIFEYIDDESEDATKESVAEVEKIIKERLNTTGNMPLIMANSQVTMNSLAEVQHHLLTKEKLNVVGTSYETYWATSHKPICRQFVPGCQSIAFKPITANDPVMPKLKRRNLDGTENDIVSDYMILKPSSGVSSIDVHKVKPGDPNPYYQHAEKVFHVGNASQSDLVEIFGEGNWSDQKCILEEYMDPSWRKASVDALVLHDGTVVPWCLTDNVYRDDAPEVLDALLSPTVYLDEAQQEACWELMRTIVKGLHSKYKCSRQFLCVEMFIKGNDVRVMEINCRISGNQRPVFKRVMNGGCFIEGLASALRDIPVSQPTHKKGRHAVTLYRKELKNTPETVLKSPDGKDWLDGTREVELAYYRAAPGKAHVYCIANSAEEAYAEADAFYDNLKRMQHKRDVVESVPTSPTIHKIFSPVAEKQFTFDQADIKRAVEKTASLAK